MAKKTYSDFDDTMVPPGLALYTSYKFAINREKFIKQIAPKISLNPKRLEICKDKAIYITSLNDNHLIQQIILEKQNVLEQYNIKVENIHGNFKNKSKKQYFLEKNMKPNDQYISDIFEKDLAINRSNIIIVEEYNKTQLLKLHIKKIYNLIKNLVTNLL